MFHYNNSEFVGNLDYQLDKKELAFMITKTLFIRCYNIKLVLSLCSLQHNIMHYINALTLNSLSQCTINEQNNLRLTYFKYHIQFKQTF